MFKKVINFFFHKNVQAPPLSWRTSRVGSSLRTLWESIVDAARPNKIGKKFSDTMVSKPTKESVQEICDTFTKETGIKLIMTDTSEAYCFSSFANILLRDIKNGRFPKDIKYVIFGHGSGTSLVKTGDDAWHVAGNPKIKIFDFIEQNVPKGNKVLVNSCEITPKQYQHLIPKDKPAIGYPTCTDASSSYDYPLKIVESGKRQIIGGYANGIATIYKP